MAINVGDGWEDCLQPQTDHLLSTCMHGCLGLFMRTHTCVAVTDCQCAAPCSPYRHGLTPQSVLVARGVAPHVDKDKRSC